MKTILILFVVAAATLPVSARSDVCEDEFLQHQREGKLGYRERESNRCEGFFKKRKVAGRFEVVSFTFGTLGFDLRKDVVLDVGFPGADRKLDRGAVHVVAMARSAESYYRLDGRLPLRWPVGDVLYPEGLNARKLGIYGIVEKGNMYVPLYVVQRPSKADDRPRDAAVLSIRLTIPVENISWQVSQHMTGRCSAYSDRIKVYNLRLRGTAAETRFKDGDIFSLELPIELAKRVCIKVEGQEQGSSQLVRSMITAYFPSYENE